MNNSIHGHEVMHFMLENGGSFTKQSLRDAVVQHFGTDTRFYTCSAEGMTAEQLIDLLEAKGKFVATENGFNTQSDKICSH